MLAHWDMEKDKKSYPRAKEPQAAAKMSSTQTPKSKQSKTEELKPQAKKLQTSKKQSLAQRPKSKQAKERFPKLRQ
jgi:hypothetical protein